MNKKFIKWLAIALILVILVVFFVLSYKKSSSSESSDAGASARPQRALNVNAFVVKPAEMVNTFRPIGRLMPDEEVQLTFESSGKITQLNIREGMAVRKGDLLAKINDATLQAELKRYEAQLQLAQDRVYRQKTLFEQDAVSQEMYETAVAELDQLMANIELVNANIAKCELRAPFDGVVGLRFVSEGAYVTQTTAIANLTKNSPLKVEFSIPEQFVNKVGRGAKILFRTTDGSPDVYEASVYAFEGGLDATNTRMARAMYPNTDGKLTPGRSVAIEVQYQEFTNALSVPGEALVPSMGKETLYLYKSGKAQPVDVVSGIRTDSQLQIVEGLNPGDTVVITGLLQIRTGTDLIIDNITE